MNPDLKGAIEKLEEQYTRELISYRKKLGDLRTESKEFSESISTLEKKIVSLTDDKRKLNV